jgi:hypothetical protein
MREILLQLIVLFGGAVVGVYSQLLPRRLQVKLVGGLVQLLIALLLIWLGYELGYMHY